jgi:hypothetical protein
MSDEKKTPKMAQTVGDDGSVKFAFSEDAGEQVYNLSDFPENVREFFAIFGMRTKLRNFTVPDSGEKEASPAKMAEKLSKGAALLKAGLLRVAREPGEKKGGGTILLEAAMIYKAKKAAAKGEEFALTEAEVAAELEALTDEQLEQLKGTTLFKLAMAEVKEKRAAEKKAALEAQAAKEAAEEDAPM